MGDLLVVDHPVLKRNLTVLRRTETDHGTFRRTLTDVSFVLAHEALRRLTVRSVPVRTPLEDTEGFVLADEVIVVPILRAGLGLVDGFVRCLPEARVGHLGMYRDEMTHNPVDYYSNIPGGVEKAQIFVVDPMLATGGSASSAVTHLKGKGARRIALVCLVSAPEGIARLQGDHPDVDIVTAAIDRELDETAYIRPGLGDAGDRIFGT